MVNTFQVGETISASSRSLLHIPKNNIAPPGRGYYMTGTTQGSRDTPQAIAEQLETLNKNSEVQFAAGYEFFPLDKMNEVPPEATAFPSRGPVSNLLILASWEGRRPDLEKKAGLGTAEIKKIAEKSIKYSMKPGENTGYSNYVGESSTLSITLPIKFVTLFCPPSRE